MKKNNQWSVVSGQWSVVNQTARALIASVLFVLFVATGLASGQERVASASEAENVELYQALLDLQNPWTVMCVAAHPDDEDGATLTILRRKYGVHTVTVFSTYGEGGQNVIGPELYEELGAIRARETEEAARVQGSEPYFLGLRDFGFSKSADEAFRVWGHDEALRRMVMKIRELRPDVIITNHDTVTGHGHHQATGRLVLEAFDAAADPKRFPEQLKNGVTTWQVKRLFVRFQFEGSGSKQAEEEATRTGKIVAINPNERDAVRGTTYAEQALQALQQHATQGPWPKTLPASGRPIIRYRLARDAKDTAPLPANAPTVLEGLRLPDGIEETLSPQAAKALLPLYSDKSRQSVLSALVNARKGGLFAAHATTNDQPRFRLMQERLSHALDAASGIKTMLLLSNKVLIPGTTTKASLNIRNFGSRPALIENISLRGFERTGKTSFPKTLAPGEALTVELQSSTPRTASITVPAAEHLYDGKLFGEGLSASPNVSIDGATFPVEAKMQLDIAPAIEIASIKPAPLIVTPSTKDRPTAFSLKLINHQTQPFEGEVTLGRVTKAGFGPGRSISLAANETREIEWPPQSLPVTDSIRSNPQSAPKSLSFTVAAANDRHHVANREIQIVWSDAHVAPNLRVGYLPSFDETLKHSLAALGVDAKELTVDDMRTGDLSSYQTIIIDNRGYQAHPELIAANSRLMDYVKAGGTLVVFYHKNNEWNPDPRAGRPQLAPYPITLSGLRVTDENAPIEFTEPQNPLLNYPNKITEEDFKGWIQERGLYYPQEWDAHYSAPLSMSDAGEQPLRGGLLVADYGSGHYIYTSLVWYRQLRAGIPGAYRFLANMISYGRN
jgi:LmbE family N-acetylglucosaminyl deacetylase